MDKTDNKIPGTMRHAIKVMESQMPNLEITLLDEDLSRTEPREHYPIGQLGIRARFTINVGNNNPIVQNTFLPAQLCEDICWGNGILIAEEFIMTVFKEDFNELVQIFHEALNKKFKYSTKL